MSPSLYGLLLLELLHVSIESAVLEWPPQRGSLWRYGYRTPQNFFDSMLYCGGTEALKKAEGKCGVCGDSYFGPREHEAGGRFASGIIVDKIGPRITVMDVLVKVTTYEKGVFEFRICPHNNPKVPVKQSCLDENLIQIEEGDPNTNYTKYYPTKIKSSNGSRTYKLTLKIPPDMRCSQCVLQWQYVTARYLGNGIHKKYRNCADISIREKTNGEEKTESRINDVQEVSKVVDIPNKNNTMNNITENDPETTVENTGSRNQSMVNNQGTKYNKNKDNTSNIHDQNSNVNNLKINEQKQHNIVKNSKDEYGSLAETPHLNISDYRIPLYNQNSDRMTNISKEQNGQSKTNQKLVYQINMGNSKTKQNDDVITNNQTMDQHDLTVQQVTRDKYISLDGGDVIYDIRTQNNAYVKDMKNKVRNNTNVTQNGIKNLDSVISSVNNSKDKIIGNEQQHQVSLFTAHTPYESKLKNDGPAYDQLTTMGGAIKSKDNMMNNENIQDERRIRNISNMPEQYTIGNDGYLTNHNDEKRNNYTRNQQSEVVSANKQNQNNVMNNPKVKHIPMNSNDLQTEQIVVDNLNSTGNAPNVHDHKRVMMNHKYFQDQRTVLNDQNGPNQMNNQNIVGQDSSVNVTYLQSQNGVNTSNIVQIQQESNMTNNKPIQDQSASGNDLNSIRNNRRIEHQEYMDQNRNMQGMGNMADISNVSLNSGTVNNQTIQGHPIFVNNVNMENNNNVNNQQDVGVMSSNIRDEGNSVYNNGQLNSNILVNKISQEPPNNTNNLKIMNNHSVEDQQSVNMNKHIQDQNNMVNSVNSQLEINILNNQYQSDQPTSVNDLNNMENNLNVKNQKNITVNRNLLNQGRNVNNNLNIDLDSKKVDNQNVRDSPASTYDLNNIENNEGYMDHNNSNIDLDSTKENNQNVRNQPASTYYLNNIENNEWNIDHNNSNIDLNSTKGNNQSVRNQPASTYDLNNIENNEGNMDHNNSNIDLDSTKGNNQNVRNQPASTYDLNNIENNEGNMDHNNLNMDLDSTKVDNQNVRDQPASTYDLNNIENNEGNMDHNNSNIDLDSTKGNNQNVRNQPASTYYLNKIENNEGNVDHNNLNIDLNSTKVDNQTVRDQPASTYDLNNIENNEANMDHNNSNIDLDSTKVNNQNVRDQPASTYDLNNIENNEGYMDHNNSNIDLNSTKGNNQTVRNQPASTYDLNNIENNEWNIDHNNSNIDLNSTKGNNQNVRNQPASTYDLNNIENNEGNMDHNNSNIDLDSTKGNNQNVRNQPASTYDLNNIENNEGNVDHNNLNIDLNSTKVDNQTVRNQPASTYDLNNIENNEGNMDHNNSNIDLDSTKVNNQNVRDQPASTYDLNNIENNYNVENERSTTVITNTQDQENIVNNLNVQLENDIMNNQNRQDLPVSISDLSSVGNAQNVESHKPTAMKPDAQDHVNTGNNVNEQGNIINNQNLQVKQTAVNEMNKEQNKLDQGNDIMNQVYRKDQTDTNIMVENSMVNNQNLQVKQTSVNEMNKVQSEQDQGNDIMNQTSMVNNQNLEVKQTSVNEMDKVQNEQDQGHDIMNQVYTKDQTDTNSIVENSMANNQNTKDYYMQDQGNDIMNQVYRKDQTDTNSMVENSIVNNQNTKDYYIQDQTYLMTGPEMQYQSIVNNPNMIDENMSTNYQTIKDPSRPDNDQNGSDNQLGLTSASQGSVMNYQTYEQNIANNQNLLDKELDADSVPLPDIDVNAKDQDQQYMAMDPQIQDLSSVVNNQNGLTENSMMNNPTVQDQLIYDLSNMESNQIVQDQRHVMNNQNDTENYGNKQTKNNMLNKENVYDLISNVNNIESNKFPQDQQNMDMIAGLGNYLKNNQMFQDQLNSTNNMKNMRNNHKLENQEYVVMETNIQDANDQNFNNDMIRRSFQNIQDYPTSVDNSTNGGSNKNLENQDYNGMETHAQDPNKLNIKNKRVDNILVNRKNINVLDHRTPVNDIGGKLNGQNEENIIIETNKQDLNNEQNKNMLINDQNIQDQETSENVLPNKGNNHNVDNNDNVPKETNFQDHNNMVNSQNIQNEYILMNKRNINVQVQPPSDNDLRSTADNQNVENQEHLTSETSTQNKRNMVNNSTVHSLPKQSFVTNNQDVQVLSNTENNQVVENQNNTESYNKLFQDHSKLKDNHSDIGKQSTLGNVIYENIIVGHNVMNNMKAQSDNDKVTDSNQEQKYDARDGYIDYHGDIMGHQNMSKPGYTLNSRDTLDNKDVKHILYTEKENYTARDGKYVQGQSNSTKNGYMNYHGDIMGDQGGKNVSTIKSKERNMSNSESIQEQYNLNNKMNTKHLKNNIQNYTKNITNTDNITDYHGNVMGIQNTPEQGESTISQNKTEQKYLENNQNIQNKLDEKINNVVQNNTTDTFITNYHGNIMDNQEIPEKGHVIYNKEQNNTKFSNKTQQQSHTANAGYHGHILGVQDMTEQNSLVKREHNISEYNGMTQQIQRNSDSPKRDQNIEKLDTMQERDTVSSSGTNNTRSSAFRNVRRTVQQHPGATESKDSTFQINQSLNDMTVPENSYQEINYELPVIPKSGNVGEKNNSMSEHATRNAMQNKDQQTQDKSIAKRGDNLVNNKDNYVGKHSDNFPTVTVDKESKNTVANKMTETNQQPDEFKTEENNQGVSNNTGSENMYKIANNDAGIQELNNIGSRTENLLTETTYGTGNTTESNKQQTRDIDNASVQTQRDIQHEQHHLNEKNDKRGSQNSSSSTTDNTTRSAFRNNRRTVQQYQSPADANDTTMETNQSTNDMVVSEVAHYTENENNLNMIDQNSTVTILHTNFIQSTTVEPNTVLRNESGIINLNKGTTTPTTEESIGQNKDEFKYNSERLLFVEQSMEKTKLNGDKNNGTILLSEQTQLNNTNEGNTTHSNNSVKAMSSNEMSTKNGTVYTSDVNTGIGPKVPGSDLKTDQTIQVVNTSAGMNSNMIKEEITRNDTNTGSLSGIQLDPKHMSLGDTNTATNSHTDKQSNKNHTVLQSSKQNAMHGNNQTVEKDSISISGSTSNNNIKGDNLTSPRLIETNSSNGNGILETSLLKQILISSDKSDQVSTNETLNPTDVVNEVSFPIPLNSTEPTHTDLFPLPPVTNNMDYQSTVNGVTTPFDTTGNNGDRVISETGQEPGRAQNMTVVKPIDVPNNSDNTTATLHNNKQTTNGSSADQYVVNQGSAVLEIPVGNTKSGNGQNKSTVHNIDNVNQTSTSNSNKKESPPTITYENNVSALNTVSATSSTSAPTTTAHHNGIAVTETAMTPTLHHYPLMDLSKFKDRELSLSVSVFVKPTEYAQTKVDNSTEGLEKDQALQTIQQIILNENITALNKTLPLQNNNGGIKEVSNGTSNTDIGKMPKEIATELTTDLNETLTQEHNKVGEKDVPKGISNTDIGKMPKEIATELTTNLNETLTQEHNKVGEKNVPKGISNTDIGKMTKEIAKKTLTNLNETITQQNNKVGGGKEVPKEISNTDIGKKLKEIATEHITNLNKTVPQQNNKIVGKKVPKGESNTKTGKIWKEIATELITDLNESLPQQNNKGGSKGVSDGISNADIGRIRTKIATEPQSLLKQYERALKVLQVLRINPQKLLSKNKIQGFKVSKPAVLRYAGEIALSQIKLKESGAYRLLGDYSFNDMNTNNSNNLRTT